MKPSLEEIMESFVNTILVKVFYLPKSDQQKFAQAAIGVLEAFLQDELKR